MASDTNITTATPMSLEAQVAAVTVKVDMLIDSLKDFKDEMRDKDNHRAAEMSEIRTSINSMNQHVRNLTITAMIGIGAMALTSAVGIAAMVWTVINK